MLAAVLDGAVLRMHPPCLVLFVLQNRDAFLALLLFLSELT